MTLYQLDWYKRVPYEPNPDGYYYWTSVYYFNANTFDEYEDALFYVSIVEEFSTTLSVARWGRVIKSPPGRENVIETNGPWNDLNGLIDDSEGYSMLNISRWYFTSSTGRKSWRLNRQPLRPSDIEGTRMSASGLYLQQLCINGLLSFGIFTNQYGELLVSGYPSPLVHQWQLRNGTHRRARQYF